MNSSGKLDGEELLDLAAWVWRSFNPGKEPAAEQISSEAAKILGRIDSNEDGELDLEEFSVYYAKTAESIARFHKKLAAAKKKGKKGGSRCSTVQCAVIPV